ncbi:DUF2141 domain-containing protein [Bizionia argentinensis JUB59]|uniref:DUF2141 domain-containing protein n=1 Tax=Bizionia argentinensis JUB59 TaxID=1046627 RepID=G2EBC3_9FLAO|nr:DUF2141 domain-containing protein [Bizionia argentinensis]EGV44357.1 DUF2141 domain-containing protein [Bizionia argentinensis JUB59]
MKTIAILVISTLISFLTHAQDSIQTYTVSVKVDNPLNNRGHILIGLHSAETFMKTEALQNIKTKVQDGKVLATFKDVKLGTYAIMVLHDENDNSRMDLEINGMPLEYYGVSNNPMLFGPPTFNAAKFDLKSKMEINIRF